MLASFQSSLEVRKHRPTMDFIENCMYSTEYTTRYSIRAKCIHIILKYYWFKLHNTTSGSTCLRIEQEFEVTLGTGSLKLYSRMLEKHDAMVKLLCLNSSGWWCWCNGIWNILDQPSMCGWYCCCYIHHFYNTYYQQDNVPPQKSNNFKPIPKIL